MARRLVEYLKPCGDDWPGHEMVVSVVDGPSLKRSVEVVILVGSGYCNNGYWCRLRSTVGSAAVCRFEWKAAMDQKLGPTGSDPLIPERLPVKSRQPSYPDRSRSWLFIKVEYGGRTIAGPVPI